MTTERIATNIRIIWDEERCCPGWFVRYTDSHGATCDEIRRCCLVHRDVSDDRLRDMAFDVLKYAGHMADDLSAISIER